MKPLLLAVLLFLPSLSARAQAFDFDTLKTDQILLVRTPDWNAPLGKLTMIERHNGTWNKIAGDIPIAVGKNGSAWGIGLHPANTDGPQKKEGDGKAPAGVFRLTGLFGYAPAPLAETGLPYTSATAETLCVDDIASKHYNTIVNTKRVTPDWKSKELMRRKDDLYEWGATVEHNGKNEPGKGSCIFLHVGRNPLAGTAGCTAMSKNDLTSVLSKLKASANPVLVQLPEAVYQSVKADWHLPEQP